MPNKEWYLETIADAKKGLTRLKDRYDTATTMSTETITLLTEIGNATEELKKHIKDIRPLVRQREEDDQEVALPSKRTKTSEHSETTRYERSETTRYDIKKEIEIKRITTKIDLINQKISKFDEIVKSGKIITPLDRFKKHFGKLEALETTLKNTAETIDPKFEKENIIPTFEEITTYSHLCINFIGFYEKEHQKLSQLRDTLKKANESFKTKSFGESLRDYIFDTVKKCIEKFAIGTVIGILLELLT